MVSGCKYCRDLERHPIEGVRSNYQGIAYLIVGDDVHEERSPEYQSQLPFYLPSILSLDPDA